MVESGKIGVRQIGVIFSVFLFVGMGLGVMMDNASGEPPNVRVSDEVLFYDIFAIWDPSKWTCTKDPSPPNLCERSGDYPSEVQWSSWFLEVGGNLHIYSPQISNGIAFAESSPYSQTLDYVIRFQFLLNDDANSKFKVVDDGFVLLTIEDNRDLYAFDGLTYTFLETLEREVWHLIEIRVHVSTNDYDVYIGRVHRGNYNFASTPKGHLLLGDDEYSTGYYGEGYWDDVGVALLHQQPWNDYFDDGNIADWSVITSEDSIFEVTPSPHSLHLVEVGEVAYGFTPFYDMPSNKDYEILFQFKIPTTYSVDATVVADGNLRIILDGDWLKAYISDTTIVPIAQLTVSSWHGIEVYVEPALEQYWVTVDTVKSPSPFPFVQEDVFVKSPSQLLMGDHELGSTGTEAYWDDVEVKEATHPPVLEWTGEQNYVDDGLHPESGYPTANFVYRIKYRDLDNDPPWGGDPKVHIKDLGGEIPGSPFPMFFDSWVGAQNDYVAGAKYYFQTFKSVTLPVGRCYTYYFTASDIGGLDATPTPEREGPKVFDPNEPPGTDIRLTEWVKYDWDSAVATDHCNVHVVWMREMWDLPDPWWNELEIYYRRSRDGGITWDPEVRLTSAYGSSIRPDIAVSGSTIHVVWSDNRNAYNNHEIYYKRSLDNGDTWDDGQGNINQDRRLTDAGGSSDYPAIAVNGDNIHVLWEDNRDGSCHIYYKRSINNGEDWTPIDKKISADGTGYENHFPRIAINDEYLHVVWTGTVTSISYYVIYTRSLNNGDTFDLETVRTTGIYAHIAVSESNIHINYMSLPNLYYMKSENNGVDWGSAVFLANTGAYMTTWPMISNAASGLNVHVVWGDRRDGDSEIYYKKSEDNGDNWGPDTRLTNAPERSVHPDIAVFGRNVHIVWADSRDRTSPYTPYTEVYYEYRYE